jgi:putative alpha-1,2-mannosidase
MLRRITIDGGTTVQQRTFYTAFYHALLHPNVISDVTGSTPASTAACTTSPPATPSMQTTPIGTSTAPKCHCSR